MSGGPFRNAVEAENAHLRAQNLALIEENARLRAELAKRDEKPPKSNLFSFFSAAFAFVGALVAWSVAHTPVVFPGAGVRHPAYQMLDHQRERATNRVDSTRKRLVRVVRSFRR